MEINGPRSEGADKAVAGAVEAARTFLAAELPKKKKFSASACQVRSERNAAGANAERTGCQPTQHDSQNLLWLHMIRTGGIVRDEGFGVQGG